MRNKILRNRCLTGLIVVALIAGCLQVKTYWWEPATVRAQDDDDDDMSGGALAVLLLAVGQRQKMRLSVATTPAASKTPYAWYYIVRNTRNEVLYRSERIEAPSGEWLFSDVSREALRTIGEPGTGEAQVMVQVFLDLSRGGNPSDFVGATQVLDEATAQSSANLAFRFRNQ